MDRTADQTRNAPLLVSAVTADGQIVETVYRPETSETALAIATREEVHIAPSFRIGSVDYAPLRASNNLLRHRALLLPSEPMEYGDAQMLLADIEAYLARYVRLPPGAAELVAAYVLLSWVYDSFNELPYLRFRGDYGTGKTRALLVAGSLTYKAFFASGASTVSPIFHTLDSIAATLVFDEADFRFTDEKAELVKILNNGNVRGFPVLRTHVTPRREFDPRAFQIFGPKIVAMRRAYADRALESRFLTVEMEPGRAGDVPINLPRAQEEEALALRNKLLLYRFRNRLAVTPDPALARPGLEPRLNQILLPLLAVAPTRALRDALAAMAEELQSGARAERGVSTEGLLLATVSELAREHQNVLTLADITVHFALAHGGDYERPIVNRWTAHLLRRMGLRLHKSNGVIVLTPGQDERLAALCARYGIAARGDAFTAQKTGS